MSEAGPAGCSPLGWPGRLAEGEVEGEEEGVKDKISKVVWTEEEKERGVWALGSQGR